MQELHYDRSAFFAARSVTTTFSTSFSMATRFFSQSDRQHIYNIYGLVRIVDEIVDTYAGEDKDRLLNNLEHETLEALQRGFSANIIVHAFIRTAQECTIDRVLITPFFESMRMDLESRTYTQELYERYIYGSAEVIGLMCLKVFLQGDDVGYERLESGARSLGAAFQKVNFLRDIADDHAERGRYYFPVGTYESFNEKTKKLVVADIKKDIQHAKKSLSELPAPARRAVAIALSYYEDLLLKLDHSSVSAIKTKRIRISNARKVFLMIVAIVKRKYT